MLREVYNKAVYDMDWRALALVGGGFILSAMFTPMGALSPWSTALKSAALGAVFNEHREKAPKEDNRLKYYFKYYFNYFGLTASPTKLAIGCGIGLAAGALAGEFIRAATGDPLTANLIAGPLAYLTSAVISATPPPKPLKPAENQPA